MYIDGQVQCLKIFLGPQNWRHFENLHLCVIQVQAPPSKSPMILRVGCLASDPFADKFCHFVYPRLPNTFHMGRYDWNLKNIPSKHQTSGGMPGRLGTRVMSYFKTLRGVMVDLDVAIGSR